MQTKKIKRNKRKSLIVLGSFLIILSFSILFLKYFNLYKTDEKEQKSLEEFYIKEEQIKIDKDDNKVEQTKSSNYDYIAVPFILVTVNGLVCPLKATTYL